MRRPRPDFDASSPAPRGNRVRTARQGVAHCVQRPVLRRSEAPTNPPVEESSPSVPRVAEGDDLESQKEAVRFLTRVILPQVDGKRSSKKIAKWLKQWHTGQVQIDQSKIDRFGDGGAHSQSLLTDESSTSASSEDEEVDDAADQAEEDDAPQLESRGDVRPQTLRQQTGRRTRSNSAGPMVKREFFPRLGSISQGLQLSSPLRELQGRSSATLDVTAQDSATSSPVTDGALKAGAKDAFEGVNGVSNDEDDAEDEGNSNPELGRPAEARGATGWPAWTASPLEAIQQWVGGASAGDIKVGADAASGSPRPKPQENLTFLEIPFHAATLLTDPEITYSVAGGTRNLPFHVLREIALVRQRRRVLCALTGFTKVNVTLAKR
ncbi:MAG: hypothetical protein BJ554DRAFT_77 [Olpidium bornovanus]|uniref:Uncharacterized protein n=1 Tax=Olpidium bornovanus TaxID=278681 RepID=A0A8H7ZU98_9FUNG|nr:MAG: hypothetical protein BJ554DRAFT_77 [Olpidium bornovanus]